MSEAGYICLARSLHVALQLETLPLITILFMANLYPNPSSGAAGTELQTTKALRELGHSLMFGRSYGRAGMFYALQRMIAAASSRKICARGPFIRPIRSPGRCDVLVLQHPDVVPTPRLAGRS